MSRPRNTPDEPGVAEVRRWRAKLWKQGGGTLKGVMKLLRSNQQARAAPPKRSQRRKSA
jgi:hypothetical protein